MTLTVHNAEITTATVEVKTLTISGKQVTLAVFRQLAAKPWLGLSGEPLGPLWGWVNYCPDPICKVKPSRGGLFDEPHIHFVWQLDRQLRRGTICDPRHRPMRDEEAHWRAWRKVSDAPQLFIAV